MKRIFALLCALLLLGVSLSEAATVIKPKSSGGGSGLTSLEGQTGATQTFTDDTNVTIVSAADAHVITWAGVLAVARGGTGLSSYTAGDMIYATGATTLAKFAKCTDGDVITYASSLPACGTVDAANRALSNLASVAINAVLIPGTAGALDFGSATKPWAKVYLAGTSGTPGTNNFNITGAATNPRTITLQDADITVAGTALAYGGTNQNTWTALRCVQVNAGGTSLESASAACGGTNSFSYSLGGNLVSYTNSSAQTLAVGSGLVAFSTTANVRALETTVPVNMTLVAVYYQAYLAGVQATDATAYVHKVCKNEASSCTTGKSLAYNTTGAVTDSETGLSVTYTAGDRVGVQVTSPSLATAATSVYERATLYFTVP